MRTFRMILPFFLFNLFLLRAWPQGLPDSTIKKIDKLFVWWNNKTSPGCAVGIVRNDSLIFAKGYGRANLEYEIPIAPETIFHMASVSKQFTAYSIMLLASQGKLHLDNDVHKYLSWFPDLKEKITIRNLLNHTSGIRDQWQLLAIAGTRLDDVITQEQIIKVLSRQEALNFKPGEQNSYSNSGFTMLAEIVKSVTGQTLRQFTDSAIFKPLGMKNTHFHDDYTEIVPNRAYSYNWGDMLHYKNSILSYSNVGATSLFTNINDMSKWIMNFYDPKVGDRKDIEQLTQKEKLNNGEVLDYAAGIAVDSYKGWKQFSHGGADAGFRTYVTVFPDLKMGFMVFSNLGTINVEENAHKLADLFITDIAPKKDVMEVKKIDSSASILGDTVTVAKYMGDYISQDGTRFTFKMDHRKVYWKPYAQTILLMKGEKDSFFMVKDPTVKFVFSGTERADTIVKEYWPGNKRILSKYANDLSISDGELKRYTGLYYCPELDCNYGIELKDHHLFLTNDKYSDTKLDLAGADHLFCDSWWMNHLVILPNNKKEVTGFEVNSGRIMHLRFNKVK